MTISSSHANAPMMEVVDILRRHKSGVPCGTMTVIRSFMKIRSLLHVYWRTDGLKHRQCYNGTETNFWVQMKCGMGLYEVFSDEFNFGSCWCRV